MQAATKKAADLLWTYARDCFLEQLKWQCLRPQRRTLCVADFPQEVMTSRKGTATHIFSLWQSLGSAEVQTANYHVSYVCVSVFVYVGVHWRLCVSLWVFHSHFLRCVVAWQFHRVARASVSEKCSDVISCKHPLSYVCNCMWVCACEWGGRHQMQMISCCFTLTGNLIIPPGVALLSPLQSLSVNVTVGTCSLPLFMQYINQRRH